MALVKYIEYDGTAHDIHVEDGTTVMQGAVYNMINGIIADCGGTCSCATCHCYIDESWVDRLDPPGETELSLLECVLDPKPNSRLSCQIVVTEKLDGLVVRVPKSQF